MNGLFGHIEKERLTRSTFLRGSLALAGACLLETIPIKSEAQTRGGVLSMIVQPEPPTLAAYMNTSAGTRVVTTKVYENLVGLDFNLKPVPQLAKTWTVSQDGKSITFHLQDGVRWHDGKPFTSADVKFSMMEVLKKYHPFDRTMLHELQEVETPNELTAIFRLNHPAPYLLRGLGDTNSPIIPSHLFASTDVRNSEFANKPVGTGPFRFVEWQRGQFIRLERNPNYWKPGLPRLDAIVARIIPDASSRADALETGNVQIAGYVGGVPLEDAKRLATLPNLTLTTKGVGFVNPYVALDFNTLRKPFDNQKVRQAIAYAIDRKFVAENIWFGFGKPATGPISSNLAATGIYTSDVKNYNVSNGTEIASKLLDEAGYPRRADGIRFEMTHDITPYGPEWKRFGEYVIQALAKIGIKATLRVEDVPKWLHRVYTDYDFDLTSNSGAGWDDPVIGVYRYLLPSKKGVVLTNGTHWSSTRATALMEAAIVENNSAKRNALYHELQRLVVEASPYVWVIEQEIPTLSSKKLHDAIVSGTGYVDSFSRAWLSR